MIMPENPHIKKTVFIILNDYNNFKRLRLELSKEISKKFILKVFLNYKNNLPELSQLKTKNISFYNINIKNNFNIFFDIFSFFKILYFLLKFKPTSIFSFTVKPNILCIILSYVVRNKFVLTFTGLGNLFINYKYLYILIFKIILIFRRKNIKFIFHNDVDLKFFVKNFKILDYYLVNGSGINLSYKRKNIYFCDKLKIISISRSIKEKGIIDFIDLANKFSNSEKFIFTLFTDISFKELIEKFNLNNSNLNHNLHVVSDDNLFIDRLTENHLFVLFSVREGLSNAMVNALNMGLPVITLDVPGNNNLIQNDKNGYLIKNDKFFLDKAYRIINDLFINKEKFKKLSKYASSNINDTYSYEHINKFYLSLIE